MDILSRQDIKGLMRILRGGFIETFEADDYISLCE